jgi:hypothetical protein
VRDVDFLPQWYPTIQRRHRTVVMQAWGTAIIVLALAIYAGAKRWEVHAARRATALCEAQITLSKQQLAQLNQKVQYQDELKRQDEIVAKLGLNVDATRMLSMLEDAMTPDMALTDVSMETVESTPPSQSGLPLRRRGDLPAQTDRRLMVKVDGVAPSDLDTSALMGHLNDVKFFENLAFGPLRDGRMRDGHVVRQFEVTFDVDLGSTERK